MVKHFSNAQPFVIQSVTPQLNAEYRILNSSYSKAYLEDPTDIAGNLFAFNFTSGILYMAEFIPELSLLLLTTSLPAAGYCTCIVLSRTSQAF